MKRAMDQEAAPKRGCTIETGCISPRVVYFDLLVSNGPEEWSKQWYMPDDPAPYVELGRWMAI
jgi:hypothetical protein